MITLEELSNFGADTKVGLSRCMNREDFYFKMIKLGLSNEYFDSLGVALEEGRMSDAFEAAHALKGVIGNLALTVIYEPLSDLTEMLRAGKEADYKTIYAGIKESRDKLLAKL